MDRKAGPLDLQATAVVLPELRRFRLAFLPVLDVVVQPLPMLVREQDHLELAVVALHVRGEKEIGPYVFHVQDLEQHVASGDVLAIERGFQLDRRTYFETLAEDLLRVGDLDACFLQVVHRLAVLDLRNGAREQPGAYSLDEIALTPRPRGKTGIELESARGLPRANQPGERQLGDAEGLRDIVRGPHGQHRDRY